MKKEHASLGSPLQHGFTLLALMIVMAIFAVISVSVLMIARHVQSTTVAIKEAVHLGNTLDDLRAGIEAVGAVPTLPASDLVDAWSRPINLTSTAAEATLTYPHLSTSACLKLVTSAINAATVSVDGTSITDTAGAVQACKAPTNVAFSLPIQSASMGVAVSLGPTGGGGSLPSLAPAPLPPAIGFPAPTPPPVVQIPVTYQPILLGSPPTTAPVNPTPVAVSIPSTSPAPPPVLPQPVPPPP